jgi:hypothetical protein
MPNLKKFLEGYLNLFKLNIPSRRVTHSSNIMNRQMWTNRKQYIGTCNKCKEVETTMHLIFECNRYSAPLWDIVKETINAMKKHTTSGALPYIIHAFMVLHMCPTCQRGFAWDLKEMGSAWGRGVREGPAPPGSSEDKQSALSEGRGNMEKEKKEGQVGRDEEGPARTE